MDILYSKSDETYGSPVGYWGFILPTVSKTDVSKFYLERSYGNVSGNRCNQCLSLCAVRLSSYLLVPPFFFHRSLELSLAPLLCTLYRSVIKLAGTALK